MVCESILRQELERISAIIREKGFKRIVVQLPDSLLHISSDVQGYLEESCGDVRIFTLADSSNDGGASCCLDEVGAEHVNADFLVHFGYSCMSKPSRIVAYHCLYPQQSFSKSLIDDVLEKGLLFLADESRLDKRIQIIFHPLFYHYKDQFQDAFGHLKNLSIKEIQCLSYPSNTTASSIPSSCDNATSSDSTDSSSPFDYIVYVGSESLMESNLIIKHHQSERTRVISIRPDTTDPSDDLWKDNPNRTSFNRLVMKRYYAVECVKAAKIIGILVGTTSVAKYAQVIERIKSLCRARGRKTYTLVMGKINPAKVGNFLEIDAFCLVACSETSLIVGSLQDRDTVKDYAKPIVNPMELEIALDPRRSWTGQIASSFDDLFDLPAFQQDDDGSKEDCDDDSDDDVPDFNLATGRLQSFKISGSDEKSSKQDVGGDPKSRQVAVRFSSPAVVFLNEQRSYSGLDRRLEEGDKSCEIVQGRRGIASSYAHE